MVMIRMVCDKVLNLYQGVAR